MDVEVKEQHSRRRFLNRVGQGIAGVIVSAATYSAEANEPSENTGQTSDLNIAGTSRRPRGYWTNRRHVQRELKKAIRENGGEFPTARRLHESGHRGLYMALQKYHGGVNATRQRMGHNLRRRFC